MTDRNLFSPRRVLLALAAYVWWVGDRGIDAPFWYYLRFAWRPFAEARWPGKRPAWVNRGDPWLS